MPTDWARLCREQKLAVEGDGVRIRFADERTHYVQVREIDGGLLLSAKVLGAAGAAQLEAPEVEAWAQNRGARLANFHLDERERLVGQAIMPLDGLTGEELAFGLRTVAEECDRFEQKLTGRDVE